MKKAATTIIDNAMCLSVISASILIQHSGTNYKIRRKGEFCSFFPIARVGCLLSISYCGLHQFLGTLSQELPGTAYGVKRTNLQSGPPSLAAPSFTALHSSLCGQSENLRRQSRHDEPTFGATPGPVIEPILTPACRNG
jgi:hypothetical protein